MSIRVTFFPPPNSILFTSQSQRAAVIFATLPLEVCVIIATFEAGLKHQEYCPFATFYDPEFDDFLTVVSGIKTFCKLKHCPHDANPSVFFVQLNWHWRRLLEFHGIWATAYLLVDMDFRVVRSPFHLRVLNMAEYAFCVRASGTHPFRVSIGCNPKQRQDLADGVLLTKSKMKLNIDEVTSRLTSLCFDASLGRLVTAMGLLDVSTLTNIYMADGASDQYPANMARLRDSKLFQSPGLKQVYCSMNFNGDSGPLVFASGHNSFQVLDLSGAGSYHEVAVEYFLHCCKSLEDFRITASTNEMAHIETFVNGSDIIDDSITAIAPNTIVELPLKHLRLNQYINSNNVHSSTPAFLSMFSFPSLEELVLIHLDTVHPRDLSWLSRSPFPSLTFLQFNCEVIEGGDLHAILTRMPVLRELVFGSGSPLSERSPRGSMRVPRPYQDNVFLRALRFAGMERLEVLELGGNCWFTRRELEQFLAVYDGVRYSLRELVVNVWYGPADGSVVNVVKTGTQRVTFQCAQVSHCNYAAANGERPQGHGGGGWSMFECQSCGFNHPLTKLEDVTTAARNVRDRMRRYWAGY